MPWNPKHNRFWQQVLRALGWVVALIALKMAVELRDPVGLILGGALAAHLIFASKGRKQS